MNTDILEPGSLRVTEDASKEVKLCSEDGRCVKGSRMRKPVPPAAASELSLSRGHGKLKDNS